MKDKGTPVSLFSFQDIITSLTGIMVIVILVIVLQLAEATNDYENPKDAPPEYQELKTKIAELTERIKTVRNEGEELPEEVKPYLNVSEEDLAKLLGKEEAAGKNLSDEKSGNQRVIDENKLSMNQNKGQAGRVKADIQGLQKDKDALDAKCNAVKNDQTNASLEKTVSDNRRKCQALREEIKLKGKMVTFSFKGTMSRQPILVECLKDGFRAKVYNGNDNPVSFMSGNISDSLKELVSWIKEMDLNQCYPVFLLRPDAFPNVDLIRAQFDSLDSKLPIGMEPLDDKVRVF